MKKPDSNPSRKMTDEQHKICKIIIREAIKQYYAPGGDFVEIMNSVYRAGFDHGHFAGWLKNWNNAGRPKLEDVTERTLTLFIMSSIRPQMKIVCLKPLYTGDL